MLDPYIQEEASFFWVIGILVHDAIILYIQQRRGPLRAQHRRVHVMRGSGTGCAVPCAGMMPGLASLSRAGCWVGTLSMERQRR